MACVMKREEWTWYLPSHFVLAKILCSTCETCTRFGMHMSKSKDDLLQTKIQCKSIILLLSCSSNTKPLWIWSLGQSSRSHRGHECTWHSLKLRDPCAKYGKPMSKQKGYVLDMKICQNALQIWPCGFKGQRRIGIMNIRETLSQKNLCRTRILLLFYRRYGYVLKFRALCRDFIMSVFCFIYTKALTLKYPGVFLMFPLKRTDW